MVAMGKIFGIQGRYKTGSNFLWKRQTLDRSNSAFSNEVFSHFLPNRVFLPRAFLGVASFQHKTFESSQSKRWIYFNIEHYLYNSINVNRQQHQFPFLD